jgi:glycosyltransferase involved in cell wall biosynthesis
MKKLIFFDHACHIKTKSFQFLEEILRQKFDVIVHNYVEFYKYEINDESVRDYDYAVYCQFLPGRFKIFHEGVNAIFVPMYDGEWGSYWAWRRIALTKMSIISFSRKLSRRARACGVKNILDVQYFPNTAQYSGMKGDPRVLLLWERGDAKFELVKKLFKPGDFKKIILFRHPEENITYGELSSGDRDDYHVTILQTPFLPRDEFLAMMKEVGTVIAPRKKEGIGMSFLEPLAMGKCVIAHDDATMNEYIENRVNGILIDFDHPRPLDISVVCRIHKENISPLQFGQQWERDKMELINFIKNSRIVRLTWKEKAIYWLSSVLYVAEFILYFLREKRKCLFRLG